MLAQLLALITNALSEKGKSVKVTDFMPHYEEPELTFENAGELFK